MTEYIHYGSNQFQRERFVPIKNSRYFCKPTGGLWASPVDAEYGWKEWNEDSNFRPCDTTNSFRFRLADNANVLHIRGEKDISKLILLQKERKFANDMVYPDFEEMKSKGVDAIEVHLSEDKTIRWETRLYWLLYGWFCDSIVVLNPDVIVEV